MVIFHCYVSSPEGIPPMPGHTGFLIREASQTDLYILANESGQQFLTPTHTWQLFVHVIYMYVHTTRQIVYVCI